MTARPRLPALIVCLLMLVGGAPGSASSCAHWIVPVETMQRVIAAIDGYDTAAAPNQSRFVADFLLGVARAAAPRDRVDSFQIHPDRFFEAWLNATGSQREDAPVSMRRVLEYGQRFAVDLAPAVAIDGAEPDRVLAVRVGWTPETAPGQAESYTYEDTRSDPDVRIRQQHDIHYLLIDFGDMVAYEHMQGVAGRPTSGGFGALFALLGMADIESVRYAVAGDASQINRTRVHKLFDFTTHAVIRPDGTAERGIPADRPQYQRLAQRLDRDIAVTLRGAWPQICD